VQAALPGPVLVMVGQGIRGAGAVATALPTPAGFAVNG
jgi:hypothetical protein